MGEQSDSELSAIYRTYAPSVLGYLRGLGVPDPEDACGEVFVSVVRDLHRFTGDADALRRWLFTIAHRRGVDAHRRRAARREELVEPGSLNDEALPHRDLAEEVATRVTCQPLLRAVDELTPDQRDGLLLRIVADLSTADVAEILGKRVGAVKTLQRRAVAALERRVPLRAVS